MGYWRIMKGIKMSIEVVEITRKGEHLGYKVYINDSVHSTEFPRKPGDLKRDSGQWIDPLKGILYIVDEDTPPGKMKRINLKDNTVIEPAEYPEPVDFYTGPLTQSVQQALNDWQTWRDQGYKSAME